MLLVFLFSLICLSSSVPLRKIGNSSMIRNSVKSGNLMQVILDHKKDPAYLLSVLSKVSPADLNAVIVLVEALLSASEADLAALTKVTDDASGAYDDATTAYEAAVLAETALAADKDALQLQLTAKSAALELQTAGVAAALSAQTAAHGAKTNALSTFEAESTRLNGEIKVLRQVIALLEGLSGSAPSYYNDIDGGGWELVRRVKAGNSWHPATDHCRGSHEYGTYVNDATSDSSFSKKFDNINFNQFLFSTGDRAKWLVATKDAVLGEYSNAQRDILMASDNPNPHTAAWYQRSGVAADPWVSLTDQSSAIGQGNILYHGNNYASTNVLLSLNGANVFIRFKA